VHEFNVINPGALAPLGSRRTALLPPCDSDPQELFLASNHFLIDPQEIISTVIGKPYGKYFLGPDSISNILGGRNRAHTRLAAAAHHIKMAGGDVVVAGDGGLEIVRVVNSSLLDFDT
jgi:hypothetical protein